MKAIPKKKTSVRNSDRGLAGDASMVAASDYVRAYSQFQDSPIFARHSPRSEQTDIRMHRFARDLSARVELDR